MVATSVFVFMSRPQRYVATSNGALHKKKLVATSFSLQRLLFVALLTNPRRDIIVTLRPQLYSFGVVTSEWCRDQRFYFEYFLYSQSDFLCRNLFHLLPWSFWSQAQLQVTTLLAKVFYFFPKTDLGDVVT